MTSAVRSQTNRNITHPRIENLHFRFETGHFSPAGSRQSEPIVLVLFEVEIFTPLNQIVHFGFELVFGEFLELLVIEGVIVELFQLLFEL
jgi:hypothetical protein